MVPSPFVALPALPLTPSGKVDRQALAAPGAARPRGGAPGERRARRPRSCWRRSGPRSWGWSGWAPRTTSSTWAAIRCWRRRWSSRLRAVFGVELPLRALFESADRRRPGARRSSRAGRGRAASRRHPCRPRRAPAAAGIAALLRAAAALVPRPVRAGQPGSTTSRRPSRLRAGWSVGAAGGGPGEVVRRHEVLRTTFQTVAGAAGPGDREPAAPAPAAGDRSRAPCRARSARRRRRRLAAAEARRPFDLARGPLLRAALLRLGTSEHVLFLTMHHIVSDGWSIGVLVRGARRRSTRPSAAASPRRCRSCRSSTRTSRSGSASGCGEVLEAELA